MDEKSFFDWEMQFRSPAKNHPRKKPHKKNALGVKPSDFKAFLRAWNEKNLPKIEK